MKTSALRSAPLLFAFVLPLGLLAACEEIAGIEDMAVYSPSTAGTGGGDAGTDADAFVPKACEIGSVNPPPKNALRFANLVPTADAVDFCVKPSSEAEYGPKTFLKEQGDDCPALSYAQVLIPLAVDPGTYDIKVVPADAADCSGAGSSEVTGVQVTDQHRVTIVRLGGAGGVDEKLVALDEILFTNDQSTRLVHAVSTDEPLFFSLAEEARLPAKITAPIAGPIQLGGVPPADDDVIGVGSINEAGYLGSLTLPWNIVVTRSGQQEGVAVASTTDGQVYSVFAVGLPGSMDFPVRGLVCREEKFMGAGQNNMTVNYLTNCSLGPLKQFTVDTINIGLYGDFAPFEDARRDAALNAVANLDGDFVCVQEITREADRTQLADLAKARFPYSYNPQYDLDTEFSDPRDQSGNVPPALGPACGDVTGPMNDVIECVTNKCAQDLGNPDSQLGDKGSDCFATDCVGTFAPLLLGTYGDEGKRCFVCLLVNLLSSETLTDTASLCGTDPRDQFAFRGASTEIMLSKYPLSDTQSYVLPSTGYRRSILAAKANVGSADDPELIDVFCGQLSYIHGSTLPYVGQYGAETTAPEVEDPITGWSSENYLQAKRATEWIESTRDPDALTIIAGDLSSGDEDATGLTAQNPATVRLFRSTYAEALAPGYEPKCNFCAFPENPYGGESGFWLAHIFTAGPQVGVLLSERTLTEKSVNLPADPFEGTVSDNFGMRAIVFEPTW